MIAKALDYGGWDDKRPSAAFSFRLNKRQPTIDPLQLITHPQDTLSCVYDRFVTADRDFHRVLTSVQRRYYPNVREPALIDRKNRDVSGELERVFQ